MCRPDRRRSGPGDHARGLAANQIDLLTRSVDFATQPGFAFLIADDLADLRADYQKLREIERDYLYAGSPR